MQLNCKSSAVSLFRGRLLYICLVCATFSVSASAQETLDYDDLNKSEREIAFLLLNKDVGTVANELAAEPATNTVSLLRKLIVYSRADHRERVRQTLEQLAQAPDWSCAQFDSAQYKIRSSIEQDDIGGWRLYYERLCPQDTLGAETFLRLWRLWRLKANLDRRDLIGLEQLAQTEVRLPLRAYYVQMKKGDPLTSSPALALGVLQ